MYFTIPRWSSMLLPKTQRNSMFPARCMKPPWKNIENSTASSTDLPGKIGSLSGTSLHDEVSNSLNDDGISSGDSGSFVTTSHGIAAYSYVKLPDEGSSTSGCTRK